MDKKIIECNFEEVFASSYSNKDDPFDEAISVIQEILLEPEFVNLQDNFMKKNCQEFDDSETNKLCYTTYFNEYTSIIEKYIEDRLKQKIKNFDMSTFVKSLIERKDEVCEDILDILMGFTDFQEFKSLMLSYKEGLKCSDLKIS